MVCQQVPDGVELNDVQYQFVQGNCSDLINLPFKDCSFCSVASVGVLEHVRGLMVPKRKV